MSAPVSEQVKAEAAKSLLERMSEKTKLVRFFRYNASAKHGVPIDSDDVNINMSSDNSDRPTMVSGAAPPPSEKTKEVVQPIVVDKGDKTKGALQALGAAGALGAALWAGTKLSSSPEPPKENQQYNESPYQYLEDIGEHLP